MKKYLKLPTLLFLTALIVLSCDSDSTNPITYPQVYESQAIIDVNVRAFTRDGEIMDATVVTNAANFYSDYLADLNNPVIAGEITVRYNSDEEVEITEANAPDEIDVRDVSVLDNISYWEDREISETSGSLSAFERFYKYHPLEQEEGGVLGGVTYTIFKRCYYAKPQGDVILFPMVDFVRYGNNLPFPDLPLEGASGANNEFDEASISTLSETDTLIIQDYVIKFVR